MYESHPAGLEPRKTTEVAPSNKSAASRLVCPKCGQDADGVSARAPGEQVLRCGHSVSDVPVQVLTGEGPRLITDGGSHADRIAEQLAMADEENDTEEDDSEILTDGGCGPIADPQTSLAKCTLVTDDDGTHITRRDVSVSVYAGGWLVVNDHGEKKILPRERVVEVRE